MLIRSQDKEMIINMAATNHIYVREVYRPSGSLIDISSDEMRLGYYSTKEKAIKVLDMIQGAYANFEASKIVSTGLAGATYARSYDTPESVAGGIKVLKEYIEMIRESAVFQMPEDSEVEA